MITGTLLALLVGAAPSPSLPQVSNPLRAPRAALYYRDELAHPRPSQAPQRIVSLAPVVTETLFLVGAGSRVVGVTRFCDRPAAAVDLPKVGGFVDPSLERILGLRPDLVVAMPSFGQRAVLDRLREAGVPVLVVFADSLDEVLALPESVGAAVGASVLGAEVRARMERELSSLRTVPRAGTREGPLRVLLLVGTDPIVVAGPDTFADDVLRFLGAEPAVPRSAPSWPQWSPEAVLTSRPDVVVLAEGPAGKPRMMRLLAAGRARIVAADHPILMRPGPSLAQDARTLAQLLAEPTPGVPP